MSDYGVRDSSALALLEAENARLTNERDAALAVLNKYIGVVEWAEGTHFLYPYEWTPEEWEVLASLDANRPLATHNQERSDG